MSNGLKTKRKKDGNIWTIGKEFIEYLLDVFVCVYTMLIIVVMPFYNTEGFARIGTDKFTFLKQLSVISVKFFVPVLVLFVLFWIMEQGKKISIKLSVTDGFALLYGGALLLSYLFCDSKKEALWGAGGWYMGLLSQLILLAIYFLVSRFWKVRRWQVLLFLPVSAIVFGLGYLNRFDIFPFDMQVDNVQFISTIGNINWYCGYLVSVFFGGYYLLWHSDVWNSVGKLWKRILLMLYVAIGFATLVTQGSMSGLFTLVVILAVSFCMSVKKPKRMLLFWQEVFLFSVMCLITYVGREKMQWQITYTDSMVDVLTKSPVPVVMTIIAAGLVWILFCYDKKGNYPYKFFEIVAKVAMIGMVVGVFLFIILIVINTRHPGSLGPLSEYSVFTFSPTWGSNRATTWKAGLWCFWEQNLLHKLIGVGPDSMSVYLYNAGSKELKLMVQQVFGELSLTNAHNEWITVLVNTGLLGFTGFVGMMVSAMVRFLRAGERLNQMVLGACGFCLLAYTVNNMFSFQQSMNVATIFVILGMGEAYARSMRLSWFMEGDTWEE